MREHGRFEAFTPQHPPERVADIVRPQNLAVIRIEPPYSPRFEFWADFTFIAGEDVIVVPFVRVDANMLLVRESSPLVWPSYLRIEKNTADAIEASIEPWLIALMIGRRIDTEIVHRVTSDPRALDVFDAARSARFFGAAPIEDVLTDAAQALYARRFADGRRVGLTGSNYAYGAALLAKQATSVRADLGAERNALARTWFGLDVYGDYAAAGVELEICDGASGVQIAIGATGADAVQIPFVRPCFPATMASFDKDDAPVVRTFGARAPQAVVRSFSPAPAQVIGGSSGRIGLIVRDDGLRAPDADVDEAHGLAEALRAQGFDASISVASAARAERFDLVHCFGVRNAPQFLPLVKAARERNIPVVVSSLLADEAKEGAWGASASVMMLSTFMDDATQAEYEQGFAARRLIAVFGASLGDLGFDAAAAKALMTGARAAIVSSEAEERRLREQFGLTARVRHVMSVVRPAVQQKPVGALRGADDYALLHAPFEPNGNQWAALRAAAALKIPLVLVGSVEHGEYYQASLAYAGPASVWLPENVLSPGQLDALYAGARVFVDVGWVPRGPARLVRAAGYGCALVTSTSHMAANAWPGLAEVVDPVVGEGIGRALQRAWDRAPAISAQVAARTAELCAPLDALRAVLGAYAEAAQIKAM
jgi:hypothetical protein